MVSRLMRPSKNWRMTRSRRAAPEFGGRCRRIQRPDGALVRPNVHGACRVTKESNRLGTLVFVNVLCFRPIHVGPRGCAMSGVYPLTWKGKLTALMDRTVKAAIIAKKPDGLSHVNAAAVALAGLTALSAIEGTLKLQAGETILIQGGAGGVASFAIQLAKHIGARVITTTSAANRDYVHDLGADEIIDYNAQDFTKVVADCDAVAVTSRRSPSRCSSRAVAQPLSLPARNPQSPIAMIWYRSGPRLDGRGSLSSASPNCSRRGPYGLPRSSSIVYLRPQMHID